MGICNFKLRYKFVTLKEPMMQGGTELLWYEIIEIERERERK